jgi:hypothetical protein
MVSNDSDALSGVRLSGEIVDNLADLLVIEEHASGSNIGGDPVPDDKASGWRLFNALKDPSTLFVPSCALLV